MRGFRCGIQQKNFKAGVVKMFKELMETMLTEVKEAMMTMSNKLRTSIKEQKL